MLRTLMCVAVALTIAGAARADDANQPEPGPWKFGTTLGLNLSQSSFSSNWAGGDKGSLVWVLNADATVERQFSKTFNLTNLTKLAYGQTTRQKADPNKPDRNVWDTPEKTTDLIQSETTGRFSFGGFVDPYSSFRLDSQFEDQSDAAGTLHFNPVKLTESAGIARVIEKTDSSEVITRLGFGFRQTFRRNFVDGGPETASFSTNDGGIEWKTTALKPILAGRVLYKGELLVFAPLFFNQKSSIEQFDDIAIAFDPNREAIGNYWKVPDVNWQNTFSAQITKIIAVNLYAQLVYDKFDAATKIDTTKDPAVLIAEVDKGVRKAAQFKETLAIGLTYRLF